MTSTPPSTSASCGCVAVLLDADVIQVWYPGVISSFPLSGAAAKSAYIGLYLSFRGAIKVLLDVPFP